MTESGIPYKKQKPKQPPDEVGINPPSPDIPEPAEKCRRQTSQYPMTPIPAPSHNFYVKFAAEPSTLQRNSGTHNNRTRQNGVLKQPTIISGKYLLLKNRIIRVWKLLLSIHSHAS